MTSEHGNAPTTGRLSSPDALRNKHKDTILEAMGVPAVLSLSQQRLDSC